MSLKIKNRGRGRMELLDNKTQGKVIDKLREDLKSGTKLSIISAYFTIFAYQELRKELNKIDSLRLLFSMPTFVENKKDINWLEIVAIAAPSTAILKFLIKI